MNRRSTLPARLAQNLRFDGLWWRKFAYLGCVYGPEWWKRYSPPVIAAIIFVLVGRNRRGATANMERILGVTGRRRAGVAALRMFVQFAHCMTETMEHYGPRSRAIRLDVPEDDDLARALKEGRGAVVVTAHFGNWDIAAKTLRDYGRPINVVMAREVNATTHEYVRQARERVGVHVIYSDTSVFSSLNIIRALQRNEIVAMQLDRSLGAGGTRTVPFFGMPAAFPAGPFVLARLSGAPLIPVFIPRLGRRHYAIRIAGRFNLAREACDSRTSDRAVAAVARAVEDAVREFPTQWFQFAPFWPAGTADEQAAPPSRDELPAERLRARR
jgi:lauroyl/myristoyl acyltransferase